MKDLAIKLIKENLFGLRHVIFWLIKNLSPLSRNTKDFVTQPLTIWKIYAKMEYLDIVVVMDQPSVKEY